MNKNTVDIPSVIIIGDMHHNMLGMLRSLGEKGIYSNLIVYDNINHFVLKSKYIKKYHIVATDDEVINILLNEFNNEKSKPIIFCTSDNAASVIDLNYNRLIFKYVLPNVDNKQGSLTSIMDKGIMMKYAVEAGFKIPQSLSYNLDKDKIDLERIKFPCIVKPLKSIYGRKEDFVICRTKNDLSVALEKLKGKVISLQIQEYLIKDYEMSIVGVVTPQTRTVIVPGIIRKIREYPFNLGSSSYSVLKPNIDDYLDLDVVKRFFTIVKYTGLFSIEFISINKQLYFLEINLRNDGNGYVPSKGNCNLPYLYIQDYLGKDISKLNHKINKPIYFMIERGDILYMLKKHLNLFLWIRDLLRVKCFILYNRKDIYPFYFYLKSLVMNKLKLSK